MDNLNEQINRMRQLIGANHGIVKPLVSEQETDCETNKKTLVDYLTTNGFQQEGDAYTRQSGDKVLAIVPKDNGEVKFYVATDTEINTNNIPTGFYEDSFATYDRTNDQAKIKSVGPYFGKKYSYQYESEQTPNRKYCNFGFGGTKPFNESTLKGTIDTLIKKLP